MKTAQEIEIKEKHAKEFGLFIQDRLMGEDWFLLNKTVEELYEDFIKLNKK